MNDKVLNMKRRRIKPAADRVCQRPTTDPLEMEVRWSRITAKKFEQVDVEEAYPDDGSLSVKDTSLPIMFIAQYPDYYGFMDVMDIGWKTSTAVC